MKFKKIPNIVLLIAATAVFSATDVVAQELEEVIVTASKRGGLSLSDIPFSVQALTGDQLDAVGAADFEDFYRFIPGLSVFDQGPGDKRYILRGLNSTGAGTVGLYLDEVVITGENAQDGGGRQPDVKLFDMDRVEVLKGPQGTTFGSSSLSGVIRYITNKPNIDETEVKIMAALRDTHEGGLGSEFEGAVNFSLVPGQLGVRAALYYLDDAGYIDNILDDEVNNDESLAGRISLRWAPTDRLTVDLMAMYQETETDGPSYYNEIDYSGAPLPELNSADVTVAGFDDEINIFNATVNYDAGFGTFTGTASFYRRDSTFNRDSSFVLEVVTGGALPALGAGRSVITQPKERDLDSYELRFVSAWDSPFQLLAGAFAQLEDRHFRSAILSAGDDGQIEANPTVRLDRRAITDLDEYAIFAELSYDISDKLTLTGGLRWFDFDITEVADVVVGFGGSPGSGIGPTLEFSEDDVIGKLNLAYQWNDNWLGYLQWAEGYRAGGPNDQTAAEIVNVTIPEGFGSDSVDTYEIGVKGELMEGKVVANAAVYYTDWADIQILQQASNPEGNVQFPYRGNGGAAEVTGLEVDITAYLTERFEFGVAASFINAELSEDDPNPLNGQDGDKIPYTPEFTFTLTGRYEQPLPWDGVTGFVGGDVFYVDERTTELRPTNPFYTVLDDYTVLNLRTGIEGEDWTAALLVNNVFDDDTVIDVFRIFPGITPTGYIRQRPRTIILRVTKSFY